MTFQQIVEAVDWTKVAERQNEEAVLSPEENSKVIDLVFSALERWGPRDTEKYRIVDTEIEFTELGIIHGFIDLVLRPLDGGKDEVIDWKTAGDLDKKWADRLKASWQGPIYAWVKQAGSYTYRGIEKSVWKTVEGRQVYRTREVHKDWPDAYGNSDVEAELWSRWAVRQAYDKLLVWPRHKPGACTAFGRPCEFLPLCETNTAPRASIPMRPLSPTGMDLLGLCPERYRLQTVTQVDETSQQADLGTAFHSSIAEVYRQLKELQ